MIKCLKQLTRTSGGSIPIGAIITYRIATMALTKEVTIVVSLHYNQAAVETGKPVVPLEDVDKFKKDGTPVQGGKFTPDDDA